MSKGITETLPATQESDAKVAVRRITQEFDRLKKTTDHSLLKINAAISNGGGRDAVAAELRDQGYVPQEMLNSWNAASALLSQLGGTPPDLAG